ncbi:Rv1157c family protein [Rhodococcus sp. NPDC003348]
MLRTRGTRISIIALAITAAAVALPATASAEPAPAVPQIPAGLDIEALASLAPAIVGAAAGPIELGVTDVANPQADLLAQAKALLEASNLPPETKSTLQRVITFLDGSGGGGPELPPESGPVISQFLYPTIGKGCIGGKSDSVGAALAVPGPAHLPPPGPKAGEAGFVFTALGTSKATAEQPNPLVVDWVNIDHPKTGRATLTTASQINPDGPATLSAIAQTGQGRVLAVVSGGLTTEVEGAAPATCSFLPTVGTVYVP